MDEGLEQTFLHRRHTNWQQIYENMLNSTNQQWNASQNHGEIAYTC